MRFPFRRPVTPPTRPSRTPSETRAAAAADAEKDAAWAARLLFTIPPSDRALAGWTGPYPEARAAMKGGGS